MRPRPPRIPDFAFYAYWLLLPTAIAFGALPSTPSSSGPGWLLVEFVPWTTWLLATPMLLSLTRARRTTRLHQGLLRHALVLFGLHTVFVGVLLIAVALVHLPSDLYSPHHPGRAWVAVLPINVFAYAAWVGMASKVAADQRTAVLDGELARAQLSALQAQLEPHFLFNTLNTLVALIRGGDSAVAIEAVELLAELLRDVLQQSETHQGPLEHELDMLERYLELQRLRFTDRLRVTWSIEPEVKDAVVPRLILQPLVENAIRQGMARDLEGSLEVQIRAQRTGSQLELTIVDNAGGLRPDCSRRQDGIGLRNTRARLRRLYGEGAALALDNVADGLRARITLPWVRAKRASE